MNPSWKILFEASEKSHVFIELTDCSGQQNPTNLLIASIKNPHNLRSPGPTSTRNRTISKANQANLTVIGQINRNAHSFFFELELEKGLHCCLIAK